MKNLKAFLNFNYYSLFWALSLMWGNKLIFNRLQRIKGVKEVAVALGADALLRRGPAALVQVYPLRVGWCYIYTASSS